MIRFGTSPFQFELSDRGRVLEPFNQAVQTRNRREILPAITQMIRTEPAFDAYLGDQNLVNTVVNFSTAVALRSFALGETAARQQSQPKNWMA